MKLRVHAEAMQYQDTIVWAAAFYPEGSDYELITGHCAAGNTGKSTLEIARAALMSSLSRIYKELEIDWTSLVTIAGHSAVGSALKKAARDLGTTQNFKNVQKKKVATLPEIAQNRPARIHLNPNSSKKRLHGKSGIKGARKKVLELIERDGPNCCWCGKEVLLDQLLKEPESASVEHVIRKADGGTNAMSNLKVACRKCNNERHKFEHLAEHLKNLNIKRLK